MKRILAALLFALAGCAGGPVPPDWQAGAHAALRSFSAAYLKGNTRVAAQEFALARADIASTARPDLLARAELLRCALQVASLEFDDCPGYAALAADDAPPERAYAAFLSGRWQDLDATLLPEQHRTLLARTPDAQTLPSIKEPLSQLVAAGVLLRTGKLPAEGMAQAAATASAQGWRRPLLAWLEVMVKRADALGEREAAAAIRRRIAVLTGGAGPR